MLTQKKIDAYRRRIEHMKLQIDKISAHPFLPDFATHWEEPFATAVDMLAQDEAFNQCLSSARTELSRMLTLLDFLEENLDFNKRKS